MSYSNNINTAPSLVARQTGHRAIRTIARALCAGAIIFTAYSSALAKEASPRKKAPCASEKSNNDARIYNPLTGNFDPAPPFGPRSNN